MWRVIAEVLIRRTGGGGVSTARRTVTFDVDAGRIPTGAELRRMAREQAMAEVNEFMQYGQKRNYSYGPAIRARIIGVTWVPN